MLYHLFIGGIIAITTFSMLFLVPLYIAVLIVIITHQKAEPFNSSFFIIFFALGVSDLGCYFLYLAKKLVFLGYVFLGYLPAFFLPFNEPNIPSAVYDYLVWGFSALQHQLTFLLTLNRFVSIVFPVIYNRHWTREKTHLIISICVLNSAVLASPLLLSDCQFSEYTTEFDGVNRTLISGPITSNEKTLNYLTHMWMIEVYVLLLADAILYGIMLKALQKIQIFGNKRKLEVQMCWLGFMIFALHLVFAVYFFLRDYVFINEHLHEWILFFASDIYDLPNGFILWMTSTTTRQIIRRKIRRMLAGSSFSVVVWIKTPNSSYILNNSGLPTLVETNNTSM